MIRILEDILNLAVGIQAELIKAPTLNIEVDDNLHMMQAPAELSFLPDNTFAVQENWQAPGSVVWTKLTTAEYVEQGSMCAIINKACKVELQALPEPVDSRNRVVTPYPESFAEAVLQTVKAAIKIRKPCEQFHLHTVVLGKKQWISCLENSALTP